MQTFCVVGTGHRRRRNSDHIDGKHLFFVRHTTVGKTTPHRINRLDRNALDTDNGFSESNSPGATVHAGYYPKPGSRSCWSLNLTQTIHVFTTGRSYCLPATQLLPSVGTNIVDTAAVWKDLFS